MATLDQIITDNGSAVNYLVQLVGNTDETQRFYMNSWDATNAYLQRVNTLGTTIVLRTTDGYEVYTPPLSDPLLPYKTIIENAIEYFNEVMVEFAAENITLGITVAGKTKDVADYLQNILRYGQSGSLYEVIAEVDVLKLAGIPANLSPFVTDARLDAFKQKFVDYLT